jgi:apolipoprotein N-acyltransferase
LIETGRSIETGPLPRSRMKHPIPLESLTPSRRFLGELGGLLVLFLGSPGVTSADGSTLLAIMGIAIWGSVAVRPLGEHRRRALLAEWLAGSLGMGPVMWWAWHVWPPTLLYIGAGFGVWLLLAAGCVRLLARHVSVPLALALGWTAVETLRGIIPPPFGLGWLRLGHQAHHHLWLSGSARVWGVEGLSLVLAGLAGVLAGLLVTRRIEGRSWIVPLAPAALALLFSFTTSPPELVAGPRVLLVQPGFSQERKQRDDARENFLASRQLTFEAIEQLRRDGAELPDLVCWGESMLYVPLFEPGVAEAIAGGCTASPWMGEITAESLERLGDWEDGWVREGIFGIAPYPLPGLVPEPVPEAERLPEGTSFLAGAEVLDVVGDDLRRRNGVVLYDAGGRRSPAAAKRFLVPGAETMLGLERFPAVRGVIERIANYVPDFAAAEETGVLELVGRDGRRFSVGATVCFDNAFLGPYTEPVRDGPLDFHLVVSNEAWYLDSCEADQMIAFSRLIALSTARSVVRATNSGISVGFSPQGKELGRIRQGGRDRQVRGTLLLEPPVPADREGKASIPLYPRVRTPWRLLLVLAPLGLLVIRRRSVGNPRGPRG